jgi:hypothetical protein
MINKPVPPHSPTPFRVGDAGHTVFGPPNGNPSPLIIAQQLRPADARFITRACNSHDALVKIAREVVAAKWGPISKDAHAALKLAEGA